MRYAVRGIRPDGGLIVLDIDAGSPDEAEAMAANQGLAILSVEAEKAKPFLAFSTSRFTFHVPLFAQELLALLGAGVSIVDAIETLQEREERPEAKAIFSKLLVRLCEGLPLSEALAGQADTFPPLFVATVKASEKTSNLAEGFERYIAYMQQMGKVRDKLVSASIYPLLLIGAGGLVVLFLLGYVVPRFSNIYAGMGGNLPWLSKLLLVWGQFIERHGGAAVLLLAVVVVFVIRMLRSDELRQKALEKAWEIPAVGKRLKLYQLSRFYRTIGMLLRGGIPMTTAMDMVSGLLQPSYRHQLLAAREAVQEGKSISVALSDNGLTTPVSVRLLRVGERGGRISEMMDRIAQFHDEELARWIDWFTRLFEPILMAIIGLVIGVVIVLMYLPIFELAGGM